MIHRGLLGHWRPLDAKLDEPDGRLVVPNTIAARTNGQPTMDALLKRHARANPNPDPTPNPNPNPNPNIELTRRCTTLFRLICPLYPASLKLDAAPTASLSSRPEP